MTDDMEDIRIRDVEVTDVKNYIMLTDWTGVSLSLHQI